MKNLALVAPGSGLDITQITHISVHVHRKQSWSDIWPFLKHHCNQAFLKVCKTVYTVTENSLNCVISCFHSQVVTISGFWVMLSICVHLEKDVCVHTLDPIKKSRFLLIYSPCLLLLSSSLITQHQLGCLITAHGGWPSNWQMLNPASATCLYQLTDP